MEKKNHDRFVKDEMRKKRNLNKDILKKTKSCLKREEENRLKKKQIDFLSVAQRIARRNADLKDLTMEDREKLLKGTKEQHQQLLRYGISIHGADSVLEKPKEED